MRFLIMLTLALAIPATAFAQQAWVEPRYSILQGSTSDRVTHFTVLAPRGESLEFRATTLAGGYSRPSEQTVSAEDGSDWVLHRLTFDHLDPRFEYQLEVSEGGVIRDQRSFRSLDLTRKQGRVGILSCMVRQLHNPWMWSALNQPANRPDLMLWIGDSVYLDREQNLFVARQPTSRLEVWEAYANSRNTLDVFFWRDLVPVLSVWDDHDAGGDNVTEANFPLMPEVRKVYDQFFANDPIPGFIEQGPGLAKSFQLFGKNFIMLDDRSFREADMRSPMWGATQEQWLLDQVRAGDNFLVNGVQFFGRFIQKDSYEYDYPEHFADFIPHLRRIGQARAARIAFVSGDTHFSEVQEIGASHLGYTTYEVTSSSVHSFGFAGHYLLKPENPRRLAVTGPHNVILLELSGEGTGRFAFDARSLGWRGGDLFKLHLEVSTADCESLLSAL